MILSLWFLGFGSNYGLWSYGLKNMIYELWFLGPIPWIMVGLH